MRTAGDDRPKALDPSRKTVDWDAEADWLGRGTATLPPRESVVPETIRINASSIRAAGVGLINWSWFHDHRQGVRSWFSSGLIHCLLVVLLTSLWMAPNRAPSGVFLSGVADRRDEIQRTPVRIETSQIPQVDGGEQELSGEMAVETITQRFPEPAAETVTQRVAKPTPEAVAETAEEVIDADVNETRESLPVFEPAEQSEQAVEEQVEIAAGGHLETPAEAIPSYEGVRFFGIESAGTEFVFIVDCSWSMTGVRWERATQELLDAIGSLQEHQSFYVMFFDIKTHRMFDSQQPEIDYVSASQDNVDRLAEWITEIKMGYETQPADAVGTAIELKPDAVFLLSDGEFPPLAQDHLFRLKAEQIVVHTVSLHSRKGQPMLRQIALETGGTHKHVGDSTPASSVFVRERSDGSDIQAIHALVGRGSEFGIDESGRIVGVRYGGADEGLKYLDGLKNLRQLWLAESRVSDEGLRQLQTMSQLEGLFLARTEITEQGMHYVATMSQLRAMSLPASLPASGLAILKPLTALEKLDLADSNITDEGLRHLEHLTSLEVLNLAETQIRGEGLKHLKRLTSLRHLSLEGTNVGDDGIAHLVPLYQLRSLHLKNTNISDAAVPFLLKLKNLEEISLDESNLTAQALRQLENIEPDINDLP